MEGVYGEGNGSGWGGDGWGGDWMDGEGGDCWRGWGEDGEGGEAELMGSVADGDYVGMVSGLAWGLREWR